MNVRINPDSPAGRLTGRALATRARILALGKAEKRTLYHGDFSIICPACWHMRRTEGRIWVLESPDKLHCERCGWEAPL